jgi:hypothetical protein
MLTIIKPFQKTFAFSYTESLFWIRFFLFRVRFFNFFRVRGSGFFSSPDFLRVRVPVLSGFRSIETCPAIREISPIVLSGISVKCDKILHIETLSHLTKMDIFTDYDLDIQLIQKGCPLQTLNSISVQRIMGESFNQFRNHIWPISYRHEKYLLTRTIDSQMAAIFNY